MKSLPLFSLLLALLSTNVSAALVDIGPYTLDDTATVTTATRTSDPGTIYTSTGDASAMTDLSLATYFYGNPYGTVDLTFGTTLYNGTGDDLIFYFIGNPATFDLSINGLSQTYSFTSELLLYDADTKYMQLINGSYYDITAALVDVSLFGLGLNDTIDYVSIGIDSNEYLALAGGFNISPTPVPLPAGLLLFISGLSVLSIFKRKNK